MKAPAAFAGGASDSVEAVARVGDATPSASVRAALAGLSLAMLLSSLGTSIANVSLPTLARVFSASFHEVRWIVLAYLLAITGVIVVVGRVGDVVGRKTLLLVGIATFTFASLLCSAASALWQLIAARALQGLGAAMMMSLAGALVVGTMPRSRVGSAMGMLGTMSAVGTALGPSLGGLLIAGFGWRAIFAIQLPLGLVAFLLAYRFLPVDGTEAGSQGARVDASSMKRVGIWRTNGTLLRASLVMGLFVATVMMATLVVGPIYLSRALGLEAASIGMIMSMGPLVAASAGVPAGRMVDRFGAQPMTFVGLFGVAVGSLLLAVVPMRVGVLGFVAPIVLCTAGYALFQTANNTALLSNVEAEQRGLISGMLQLARNLGLIAGAAVLGTVFTIAAGTSDIAHTSPDAAARGLRTTFALGAMLVVAAVAVGRASVSRNGESR